MSSRFFFRGNLSLGLKGRPNLTDTPFHIRRRVEKKAKHTLRGFAVSVFDGRYNWTPIFGGWGGGRMFPLLYIWTAKTGNQTEGFAKFSAREIF